jgi:exodeoxyribonuclease X
LKAILLDTETAGLEGGVCDLAMIELDSQLNVVNSWEALIDPERPIGAKASEIHGITDDMVADEPTLSEFMELAGWPLQCEDLLVIAYNVAFDAKMLAAVLPPKHRTFCALKLARGVFPDMPNHKLQTIREKLDLDGGTAHRAMGDVETTLSFLRHVAALKQTDLLGLLELNKVPVTPDTRWPFGKHKGVRLKDTPKDYVKWAVANMTLEPDFRATLAALI